MKSGFGGFQKLSANAGKRTAIDSFGTLSTAVKSVLGDSSAAVFSTAVPSSILVDNSGLVYQWNSQEVSTNAYFTQSSNTVKPALTNVHTLGKYQGIYCAGSGQRMTIPTLAGGGPILPQNVSKPVMNFFIYYKYAQFPTTANVTFLFTAYNTTSPLNTSNYPGSGYDNASVNLFLRYAAAYPTGSLKTASILFNTSSATAMFGNNVNTFRMIEEIYDASNRTVTSSFYDANKNLINITPSGGALTASSNSSSFTFSATSIGVANSNWDQQFPSSSFAPIASAQIGSSTGDVKISYHTFIRSSRDTAISAATVQNLKNLLDKVYGA